MLYLTYIVKKILQVNTWLIMSYKSKSWLGKLIYVSYKYLHNDIDDINLGSYILWGGGIGG